MVPKARARFRSETERGRMLGGPGWGRDAVREFLQREFYVTPCGAVPKGTDPHGRIIHDYSFAPRDSFSLNSSLLENSVQYISFTERVKALSSVSWYFAVDLKNGYRQLPVHPRDWHTQVYSLGQYEHYVDVCMPFGKANSSKIFCFWVENWCQAFKKNFRALVPWPFVLESYVDDIFGGANSKIQTADLKNQIIKTGTLTTAVPNLAKCHGPSQKLAILGMMFDAVDRRVSLPPKKQQKYLLRLNEVLSTGYVSSKDLEKIVGYLVWASYAEPFGRPFISAVSAHISRVTPHKNVQLIGELRTALLIWVSILQRNKGISFTYILNQMVCSKDEWFVDASTSWGIGGCAGTRYFSLPNKALTNLFALFGAFPDQGAMRVPSHRLPIAYIELLAALVAMSVFSKFFPNMLIILNTDNTDVVAWLRKGRCSRGIGFKILTAIEFFKRKYGIKVSPRHIPGRFNTSADALSRGTFPGWVLRHGTRLTVDTTLLESLIHSPLGFWTHH